MLEFYISFYSLILQAALYMGQSGKHLQSLPTFHNLSLRYFANFRFFVMFFYYLMKTSFFIRRLPVLLPLIVMTVSFTVFCFYTLTLYGYNCFNFTSYKCKLQKHCIINFVLKHIFDCIWPCSQ